MADFKTMTPHQMAALIGTIPSTHSTPALQNGARAGLKYYLARTLANDHPLANPTNRNAAPVANLWHAYHNEPAPRAAHDTNAWPAKPYTGPRKRRSGSNYSTATTTTTADTATATEGKTVSQTDAASTAQGADAIAAAIQAAIAAALGSVKTAGTVDEAAVRRIVAAQIAELDRPVRLVIEHKETGELKDVGTVHNQFPRLVRLAKLGRPIWIVGPAGSGKTTAAQKLADTLSLNFYFNGAISDEYKLLGFVDAQGRIVSRPFREAWTNGGVYLFDEVDGSMPGAVLAFNAALANGMCDFPDGCVKKHPDCIILAAANTFGMGASFQYVGRMKQDAAFADRFIFLRWGIDEALERAICGNDDWHNRVKKLRNRAEEKGLQVVISPRASIMGAEMLAAGFTISEAEEMTVRKGMTGDQWRSIAA